FLKCYEDSIISIETSNYKEIMLVLYKFSLSILFNIRIVNGKFLLFFKLLSLLFFFYVFYLEMKKFTKNINLDYLSKTRFLVYTFLFCFVVVEIINYSVHHLSNTDRSAIDND